MDFLPEMGNRKRKKQDETDTKPEGAISDDSEIIFTPKKDKARGESVRRRGRPTRSPVQKLLETVTDELNEREATETVPSLDKESNGKETKRSKAKRSRSESPKSNGAKRGRSKSRSTRPRDDSWLKQIEKKFANKNLKSNDKEPEIRDANFLMEVQQESPILDNQKEQNVNNGGSTGDLELVQKGETRLKQATVISSPKQAAVNKEDAPIEVDVNKQFQFSIYTDEEGGIRE